MNLTSEERKEEERVPDRAAMLVRTWPLRDGCASSLYPNPLTRSSGASLRVSIDPPPYHERFVILRMRCPQGAVSVHSRVVYVAAAKQWASFSSTCYFMHGCASEAAR